MNSGETHEVLVTDAAGRMLARFRGAGVGAVLRQESEHTLVGRALDEPMEIQLTFLHRPNGAADDGRINEAYASRVVSEANLPLGGGEYVRTLVAEAMSFGRRHEVTFHIVVWNAADD